MPLPSKKLRVFPNPWVYIDHLGRPAGRLPFDAFEHSQSPGAVGAEICDVKLVAAATVMRVAGRALEVQFPQHDTRIKYTRDPVSIPASNYYRDAVKRGDLVAADQETAALCGVTFTDPAKALANAKAEAVAKFNAETGEDAYAAFGSVDPIFDTPSPLLSAPVAPTTEPAQAAKGDK